MVPQQAHIKAIRTVQENKAQSQIAPAFEKMIAQFADAHPGVYVRPAECLA